MLTSCCRYLLLVIIFNSFTVSATTLTFSTGAGFGKNNLAERILSKAYNELAIEIEVLLVPTRRGLPLAEQGKVDGELLRLNILQDYPDLIMVKVPLFLSEGRLYANQPNTDINSILDISHQKVGMVKDSIIKRRMTAHLDVREVDDNEQLFRLLQQGRFDVVLVSDYRAKRIIKKHNFQNLHRLTPVVYSFPVFHFLHKKHKTLIPKLETVLQSMRDNGELEAFMQSYLAGD